MSTSEPAFHPGQYELDELPNYRPLSISAIIGLVLGLASLTAVLHPVLWLLPLLSVAINLVALNQIKQSGASAGRWMAVTGLGLSLLIGTAAPARVYSYEYLQRRDARQFAQHWFDSLRNGQPQLAHQLTMELGNRALNAEQVRVLYQQSETQRNNLRTYVDLPLVHTLLALGEKADVRYYENEVAQTDGSVDLVKDVYAVSYEEDGQKQTFFVSVEVLRNLNTEAGPVGWRLSGTEGGYRPRSWPAAD